MKLKETLHIEDFEEQIPDKNDQTEYQEIVSQFG